MHSMLVHPLLPNTAMILTVPFLLPRRQQVLLMVHLPPQKTLRGTLQISEVKVRISCSCIGLASINGMAHSSRNDAFFFSLCRNHIWDHKKTLEKAESQLILVLCQTSYDPAFRVSKYTL